MSDEFSPILLAEEKDGAVRKVAFQTCPAVCSERIDVTLEGDTVRQVQYTRGCHGNTQGIAALCEGMTVQDLIDRLGGIDCHGRGTSCPDQLARSLRIARVVEMERRFETLCGGLPGSEQERPALQEYMDSGAWLSDFEADERGELPADLKRGVLSEDGLYNLLQS